MLQYVVYSTGEVYGGAGCCGYSRMLPLLMALEIRDGLLIFYNRALQSYRYLSRTLFHVCFHQRVENTVLHTV